MHSDQHTDRCPQRATAGRRGGGGRAGLRRWPLLGKHVHHGSFRAHRLADPYWAAIPGLRTDTCGIAAFIMTAVGLVVSEYLRLERRRGDAQLKPTSRHTGAQLAGLAVSETVAILLTGLVVYLSVNTVTRPETS